MVKEYSVEDIKQLDSTERLLKLFPKILKIKEQNFNSLLFVTGLILALERILTFIIAGGIKSGITKELKNPNIIEFIIDELTLSSKVKILEKAVKNDPVRNTHYKKFLKYLSIINEIRNKIFHGKLTNLKYKERPIHNVSTQHSMLLDYVHATREAIEKSKISQPDREASK